MRSRFLLITALVLVVGSLVGWRMWSAAGANTTTDARLQAATLQTVTAYESRIETHGEHADNHTQLGFAYIQAARETGDGDYNDRAADRFRRALELDPADHDAMRGLGLYYLTLHRFADALAWGERGRDVEPRQPDLHGLIADALLELGRYDEAVAAAQTMVDLRPDMTAFTRISYLRELLGERAGAIDAMQRAISAPSGTMEHNAWSHVFLGHLYFNQGDLALAQRNYERALQITPLYGHAYGGLARVALAQGKADQAVTLYADAYAAMPIPEFLIAYGEALEAAGRTAEAQETIAEATAILQEERDGGMDVDDELATLLLDHGDDDAFALELAQDAYERRPTVKIAHLLAWALLENGRTAEAATRMAEALRYNTEDATMHFHAAQIAQAQGDTAEAVRLYQRALALNPHFGSADAANTALDALGA